MSETERNNPGSLELVAFLSDTETRDIFQSLIYDLEVPNTEVRIGSVDDALEYVGLLASWPRQLVVDITDSMLPLSDMNRLADIAEPGTRIVVVGDRNDVGLFRDLMQLGVADYLVKPIAPTMLRRSVNFGGMVGDVMRPSRSGKSVAVIGARGGVGTTTVACNIAWQMAYGASRRTLLVDLDVHHGAVNMMFDLKPSTGLMSAMEDPASLGTLGPERVVTMKGPRLFTLTAEVPLKTPSPVNGERLEALNPMLANHYHYMIYDCPWHSGDAVNSLVERSDYVVIVADPSMVATRNLSRIARLWDPRTETQRMLLVANHIRPRTSESLTPGAMEAAFGRSIDHTLPNTPSLIKGQNLGRAQEGQPTTYTSVIADITRDLIGGGEHRGESTSLWKRMFS